VGIGSGTKDFANHSNILRLVLGDETLNLAGSKIEDSTKDVEVKNGEKGS
jgi:uncharacterized protein (DUF111 family)